MWGPTELWLEVNVTFHTCSVVKCFQDHVTIFSAVEFSRGGNLLVPWMIMDVPLFDLGDYAPVKSKSLCELRGFLQRRSSRRQASFKSDGDAESDFFLNEMTLSFLLMLRLMSSLGQSAPRQALSWNQLQISWRSEKVLCYRFKLRPCGIIDKFLSRCNEASRCGVAVGATVASADLWKRCAEPPHVHASYVEC